MSKPDNNWRSYANVSGVQIIAEEIKAPDDFVGSDTIHFSNVQGANVAYSIIYGLKEDCIDIQNKTRDVIVQKCDLYPTGQYGLTIKGGSSNIELSDNTFFSHGSVYDIDLGNWSDQSMDKTTGVILRNLTAHDGKPVRVRVLWADRPIVVGGNVKVTVYPKIVVMAYRWLRKRNLVP